MTQQNKKTNIREELERARECLKEADLLHSNGHTSGAISRLYYFVFHSVRALILSGGFESKTHEGAQRLFSLHFVKQRLIKPRMAHVFTRLMKYREEADYNPSYVFTPEDYREFEKDAQELHRSITTFLSDKHLI